MCAEMEFRKESMVKMWNQCHVCCRPHLDPNKPRLSLRRNPVGSSGLPGDPLSDLETIADCSPVDNSGIFQITGNNVEMTEQQKCLSL